MKRSEQKDLHTISLLVANKPGVLVRIALVFARRAFNIESLVVSPTVDPRFSRMTITAKGNPEALEQIIKQAAKLIDVIHAGEHAKTESVEKELALFKIRYNPQAKPALEKLLKLFRARLCDTTNNIAIIEHTGNSVELDALEEELRTFGILEMVRTGKIAMVKGKEST